MGEGIFELYGFATQAELNSFRLLIGVSGVGPKAALAILSTGTPRAVHIQDGDTAECRITGPDGFSFEPLVNPVIDLKLKK